MENPWEKLTEKQLADGANTGLQGQGHVVEAMRRLRESNKEQQGTTNVLTGWIMGLTAAIAAFTVVNIVLVVVDAL